MPPPNPRIPTSADLARRQREAAARTTGSPPSPKPPGSSAPYAPVKPTAETNQQQCSNCGNAIGRLESSGFWNDRLVCRPCLNRLVEAQEEAANVRSRAGQYSPPVIPVHRLWLSSRSLLAGTGLLLVVAAAGVAWFKFYRTGTASNEVTKPQAAVVTSDPKPSVRSIDAEVIKELQSMQFEYANQWNKKAQDQMCLVIVDRAKGLSEDQMPQDLGNFVEMMRTKAKFVNMMMGIDVRVAEMRDGHHTGSTESDLGGSAQSTQEAIEHAIPAAQKVLKDKFDAWVAETEQDQTFQSKRFVGGTLLSYEIKVVVQDSLSPDTFTSTSNIEWQSGPAEGASPTPSGKYQIRHQIHINGSKPESIIALEK